jgi:hypothetical protein
VPKLPNLRSRNATRAPYMPKLVIPPGSMCAVCQHPRSSHSVLVVQAACKAAQCPCDCFEPVCGCGHLLSWHTWGTAPTPWECAKCPCLRFGAAREDSPTYQAALFDMTR